MKSWIFEQFNVSADENPAAFDPANYQAELAWRRKSWIDAEALGYEGIFFSEHHFGGARVSPAPALVAATAAALTKRLRIGILGWVLPLSQPWRVLEEIGVLDHLSGGRLEVGLARGSNPEEAVALGMDREHLQPMFDEARQIIRKAMDTAPLDHAGTYWTMRNLHALPSPLQRPFPPVWATVRSARAAQEAAREGHKVCTGFLSVDEVCALFDEYRNAIHAGSEDEVSSRLAIRRCIFVAPGRAEALEQADIARHRIPSILDQDTIAGSPADVVEQIVEQARRTGAGHMVGFFTGNTLDRNALLTSYRLYGLQVIPALGRHFGKQRASLAL
ncbi:LLM class flavin-dependent oxidoreductase [Paracidovorax avenae]|uniref:LLM class flavin-dependent oxidoreductase n=1 Tax=Paracidovorax avenae TaxID=80867 RepID=UPI000D211148|nr:LLM class flavin-dependent oxidoreductase [Paracidovorax avenae]AVT13153.1 LLM class flavin-dependent oxidoreductase [Paracidovorax avenae]